MFPFQTGVGKTKGEIPLNNVLVVEPVEPEYLGNRTSVFQVVSLLLAFDPIETSLRL